MSEVTEKWKHHEGQKMSREEVLDRLNEIQNIDLDNFYTEGKPDYDKIVATGNTHLLKAITTHNGKVVDFEIYNDFSGYIYLIISEIGPIKIGIAEDVKKRFSQIDTASPCKLELYHSQLVKNALGLEKLLHKKFESKRVKGEWFNLDSYELQQAKEIIDNHEWKKQTKKS